MYWCTRPSAAYCSYGVRAAFPRPLVKSSAARRWSQWSTRPRSSKRSEPNRDLRRSTSRVRAPRRKRQCALALFLLQNGVVACLLSVPIHLYYHDTLLLSRFHPDFFVLTPPSGSPHKTLAARRCDRHSEGLELGEAALKVQTVDGKHGGALPLPDGRRCGRQSPAHRPAHRLSVRPHPSAPSASISTCS